MSIENRRRARLNPPMAVLGTVCLAVSVAVLAGARDWSWTVGAWLVPLVLVGFGLAVLTGIVVRRP